MEKRAPGVSREQRGAVRQHPRGVELDPHVGDLERDRLVLGELAAEGLAGLRVLDGGLVGRLRDPDALRGDRDAGVIEGRHGDR